MAKEQVLDFEPARRLEDVDDEHCERMQEREHRCSRSCDDSTRRCDSQAGWDFRKGQDNEAGKLDKAEEIVGVVLPANEDPALPLNPGEEALDEPASRVAA